MALPKHYAANPYLQDAQFFLKQVASQITNSLPDSDVVFLTMNFALGMERLLKSILYQINPTFVFIEPKFNHTLTHLYADKLVDDTFYNDERAKKCNQDTITFSKSLFRCQHVSKTCKTFNADLFRLGAARDIIAHCDLSLLDIVQCRDLLLRDFYKIVKAFEIEMKLTSGFFFGNRSAFLCRLSASMQQQLSDQVSMLLEAARETWRLIQPNRQAIEQRSDKTRDYGRMYLRGTCPACQNQCVYDCVDYESEIDDPVQGKIEYTVLQPYWLKCEYCNLELDNPAMLSFINFNADPSQFYGFENPPGFPDSYPPLL